MNVLDRMIDKVNERQQRQQRQGCRLLVFAGIGVFILVIVMAIIGFIISAIEEAGVVSDYGEQVASLCDPMPVSSDSLENAPQGDAPLQILLLELDSKRRHTWFSDIPTAWRAENEASVALVGCIAEASDLLETCEYVHTAGEGTVTIRIKREQTTTTVVLLNAQTGRRIATQTVTGQLPPECPSDDESITTSSTSTGASASLADFADWLETFIFSD